ncbi:MAG: hypothetical protein ACH346_04330 [Chthoniobacterales bacterium]
MKYFLVTVLVLDNFFPAIAKACEGCKMGAVNGLIEPQTMMAGVALSWSVLFMLAVVFALLTGFIWFAYKTCKKIDQATNF